jgi:hypothetical protein
MAAFATPTYASSAKKLVGLGKTLCLLACCWHAAAAAAAAGMLLACWWYSGLGESGQHDSMQHKS